MAHAQTDRFGLLEYDPQAEIAFPYGIPGFDAEHRFLLVERTELAPFVFLQSLATPSLCFTALPASALDPNYDLQLTPEDHSTFYDVARASRPAEPRVISAFPPNEDSLLPLALLTATDHGLTANLLAPVVIHLARRIGLQSIRADDRYSHCHRLGTPCS